MIEILSKFAPYAIFLICPIMMLFMMKHHDGDDKKDKHEH